MGVSGLIQYTPQVQRQAKRPMPRPPHVPAVKGAPALPHGTERRPEILLAKAAGLRWARYAVNLDAALLRRADGCLRVQARLGEMGNPVLRPPCVLISSQVHAGFACPH